MFPDTGLEILEACERNAWNNRHLFRDSGAIHVRELNWMSESLKNGKQWLFYLYAVCHKIHLKILVKEFFIINQL